MTRPDAPYTFAFGGHQSEDEERAELTRRLRAAYAEKFEAMGVRERTALLVDVAEAMELSDWKGNGVSSTPVTTPVTLDEALG